MDQIFIFCLLLDHFEDIELIFKIKYQSKDIVCLVTLSDFVASYLKLKIQQMPRINPSLIFQKLNYSFRSNKN